MIVKYNSVISLFPALLICQAWAGSDTTRPKEALGPEPCREYSKWKPVTGLVLRPVKMRAENPTAVSQTGDPSRRGSGPLLLQTSAPKALDWIGTMTACMFGDSGLQSSCKVKDKLFQACLPSPRAVNLRIRTRHGRISHCQPCQ